MFRKLILASAVSLAMLPGASWSLGLGGIRTQSALNELFSGEIDLYDVKPDELDTVQAVLASPAEFAKVGSERSHFLTRLRFSPQVSAAGKTVVRVESREPMREPYLDFLVEVVWPKGRIVKGYTVLLDPPVTLNRSAPRVAPPRRGSRATATSIAPAAPRDATGYPLRYGPVGSGTGLWRVARTIAPSGATVQQTAMALYRSNRDAFIRGNINKLKLGAELEIPTPDELFALDARSAEREFSRALRGGRVTSTPITDISRVRQSAARLEIAAAPAPTAGQPARTPPQETGASAEPEFGTIQRELLLVQESAESTRQESEELRSRVRELETQLTDIKKLLDLRNDQLAQLQAVRAEEQQEFSAAEPLDVPPDPTTSQPESELALEPALAMVDPESELESALASQPGSEAATEPEPGPEAATEPEPGPELATEPEPGPELATEPMSEPELTTASGLELQPAPEPGQTPDETLLGVGEVVAEPPASTLETTPEIREEPEAAETAVTPRPSEPRTDAPPPASVDVSELPSSDKPFWHGLSASTLGMAVGIPVLGLFGFWMLRRRKGERDTLESENPIDEDSALAEDTVPQARPRASSERPEPIVENVDFPSQTSAPSSDFGNLDEDTEEADILSEVDVYIAFGRYREAENLLAEEIKASPERMDLKLKLGEVHHGTGNAQALDSLLAELHEAGAEALYPDQWQHLTRLSEEIGGTGAPSGKSSVVAFRTPAAPVEDATETTRAVPRAISQEPESAVTSEMIAEFELSDMIDDDGRSLISEEPPIPLEVSETMPARGGERAEGGVPGVATHGLELDDADLGPLEVETTQQEASSVFDSQFDDLADFDFHGEQEQDISATPEPAVPASPTESAASEGGASLDSLGGGDLGKDTTAEDIFSSQWEMDSGLWDEVATKIDLARAYMEMEDPDAARAILEEVAAEGNDEQKGEAKEMLSRLN